MAGAFGPTRRDRGRQDRRHDRPFGDGSGDTGTENVAQAEGPDAAVGSAWRAESGSTACCFPPTARPRREDRRANRAASRDLVRRPGACRPDRPARPGEAARGGGRHRGPGLASRSARRSATIPPRRQIGDHDLIARARAQAGRAHEPGDAARAVRFCVGLIAGRGLVGGKDKRSKASRKAIRVPFLARRVVRTGSGKTPPANRCVPLGIYRRDPEFGTENRKNTGPTQGHERRIIHNADGPKFRRRPRGFSSIDQGFSSPHRSSAAWRRRRRANPPRSGPGRSRPA